MSIVHEGGFVPCRQGNVSGTTSDGRKKDGAFLSPDGGVTALTSILESVIHEAMVDAESDRVRSELRQQQRQYG